jgi:hypothetical protein
MLFASDSILAVKRAHVENVKNGRSERIVLVETLKKTGEVTKNVAPMSAANELKGFINQ